MLVTLKAIWMLLKCMQYADEDALEYNKRNLKIVTPSPRKFRGTAPTVPGHEIVRKPYAI